MDLKEFQPTLLKKAHYEKISGLSLRHVIFHRAKELQDAKALVRFGRHWMVDPQRLESYIRDGGCAEIAK